MTEPTIAYTFFALLLASSACLLIGILIGWFAQSYQNRAQLVDNEARLREKQQEIAELRIQGMQEDQNDSGESIRKLSGVNDQKTALIKKLMEKQLKQQQELQQQSKRTQAALQQVKKQRTATQIWRTKADRLTEASEANNSEENKLVATRHVEAEAARALTAGDTKAVTGKTGSAQWQAVVNTKDKKTTELSPANAEKAETIENISTDKANTDTTPAKAIEVTTKVTPLKAEPVPAKLKKSRTPKRNKVKDDLTRIKGIGPTIELALNEVGIMNFDQLAKLTPKRVNKLDKQLGRYGRIARLNWVDAAKKLVADNKKELAAA